MNEEGLVKKFDNEVAKAQRTVFDYVKREIHICIDDIHKAEHLTDGFKESMKREFWNLLNRLEIKLDV